MSTNLAPGATYKGFKPLPSIIPSHTLPDIKADTIIIGVCGVNIEACKDDDWFLSDFCAFNFLLKGLGKKQTWLSAVSEEDLIGFLGENPDMSPGLLHGNPYKDRKVVFSKQLFEREELTRFSVCESPKLVSRLLAEVRDACVLASQAEPPSPILLLLFGHGCQSLGVYLDYSKEEVDRKALLTIDNLREAINPGAHVSVITTACYSGGWAICPSLNTTTITAAGAWDKHNVKDTFLSLSWPESPSVGRACGSIFATTLIETLTAASEATESDRQSPSYNEFCRTIISTLAEDVTRFPEHHEFRFAAQNDDWVECCFGRTGVPLTHFQQRWDQAPIYEASAPNSYLNLDPRNPFTGVTGPVSRTGGMAAVTNSRSGTPIRRMMQANAAMLAKACPGDWNIAPNRRLRGQLLAYAAGKREGLDRENYLIDVMLYRLEMAQFVDGVVDSFGLARPFKQSLLYWDRLMWDGMHRVDQEQLEIHKAMVAQDLIFHEDKSGAQCWGFGRSHQYLAAAIYESKLGPETVVQITEWIGELFKRGAASKAKTVGHASVRGKAAQWLGSIGRGIRSMAPTRGSQNRG